jgi:hypothetical protein
LVHFFVEQLMKKCKLFLLYLQHAASDVPGAALVPGCLCLSQIYRPYRQLFILLYGRSSFTNAACRQSIV